MSQRRLIAMLFLISGSILPVAVSAQQPDTKQPESQAQPQTTPVQPERTPQQSDQAREQENRNAEATRINPNWTTRQRNDERADMDRRGRMDQDNRTVGRNWHGDYDDERGSRYGWTERGEDRYRDSGPRSRVKTCIEYENGDEFCRYRD